MDGDTGNSSQRGGVGTVTIARAAQTLALQLAACSINALAVVR
jgi:hypothetical protein